MILDGLRPVGAQWKSWEAGWVRADDWSLLCNQSPSGTVPKPSPSEQMLVSLNRPAVFPKSSEQMRSF